ncbi:hypothetical protein LVY72_12280 [Arthrobacter sp. I2-34]|uniref:Uncharacterized protein n=1 Tax=Arthrobacter hankyongi TaxID=2904801 RepID=A0ABS9L7M8_9MICC|nr:hypothetical protein [Arthrobacter hankyongi]MCG2622682.1 hypothetical protein [Arthrobacter hankyongi]
MSFLQIPAHTVVEEPTGSAVPGHPDLRLVRGTVSDRVIYAGSGLGTRVSPVESIDDACARLRSGVARLAADLMPGR